MKWLDHRSRPDYRAYNFTRNAVASLNHGLFPLGGTAYGAPSFVMQYIQELVHAESGITTNGAGNWAIARGAEKAHGLLNGTIVGEVYSYAAELRENYPSSTVSGWGIVDRTDVQYDDVSDSVSTNPFGISYRITGGTLWVSPGDPYGSTDELTSSNFYTRGFGIQQADGTGDWYLDLFGVSPGPGWTQVGEESAAMWRRYPYTYIGTVGGGNRIGASNGGDFDMGEWNHWQPTAQVNVSSAQSFGLPYFLRGRDATVTAARMELQFSNLQKYTSTITTTITDEETGARTTTGTSATTLEDIGIAVLGGKRVGTRYEWDVLANTTGGTGNANTWCVIDATGIINAMLAGKGTYHTFAIVPSPAVEVMENADSVGYMKKLMPRHTFGYWDDGSGTPTMDENRNYGGQPAPEGSYYSESIGEYVTWDSVELGNVEITFDPLLGEEGQVVLPGVAFPRMD